MRALVAAAKYTCPMHPQIVRDAPGSCPICGMTLEPLLPTAGAEDDSELRNMTRRFWVSAVLSGAVLLLAMGHMLPGNPLGAFFRIRRSADELALATPVVLWGGWPFFVRGWQSLVHRSLNMFTLIALGVGVAWGFRSWRLVAPDIFPPCLRMRMAASVLLRGRRRHRGARACWPGAGTARPCAIPVPHPRVARSCAEDRAPRRRPTAAKRTCRSSTSRSATDCACGRARRFR